MSDQPDYYKILGVSVTATQQQVRDAYKRASLRTHPDRVPADSPERPARTREFQQVNDAYYTLSDPERRRDYDGARSHYFGSDSEEPVDEDVPRGGAGGFPWSTFGFGGSDRERQGRDSQQFGSVFEEMMREEGLADDEDDGHGGRRTAPTKRFWSIVGGLSGGALGFIVANVPGALAGAVAGNRLGAVRDAKGKSVYEVFVDLPQGDRARFLSELATKVFQTSLGG